MTPEELKKARSKLKLTREEMAVKLEMGLRTYLQRENGERPIDIMMEYAVNWLLRPRQIQVKKKKKKVAK